MSNINVLTMTTVARSAAAVRVHGFGMGHVCPKAGFVAGSLKRRVTDAAQAAAWATPGSGQPWSPPVT